MGKQGKRGELKMSVVCTAAGRHSPGLPLASGQWPALWNFSEKGASERDTKTGAED